MAHCLKALFWLGVVAFLMPHEPDLGFGHRDRGLAPAIRQIVLAELSSVKARWNSAQPVASPAGSSAER
jgi:hypothetical protein